MTTAIHPSHSRRAGCCHVEDQNDRGDVISKSQLPSRCGLALKPEHFQHIVRHLPDAGFFEVHAENYMVDGGPFHHYLGRIAEHYPLSIHGVGLSLGGAGPLDRRHLDRLALLLARYEPAAFSEHLAWSGHAGCYYNDLLPLPYDEAMLRRVCEHIDQTQTFLRRRMLLENPASYVEFAASTFDEPAFISEVVRRTGCGLLLDINNVYISSVNHGRDAGAWLRAMPLGAVGEIHVAGFAAALDSIGGRLLIDSHDAPVAQAVWELYEYALGLVGPTASLLERDGNIPEFDILLQEASIAERMLDACRHGAGCGT